MQDIPKQTLNIAIVGSGLAASVVADTLAGHNKVTIFERGGTSAERPNMPDMPGRPLGLYPSYAYGLGGTTNFWHGGLVPFLDGEFAEDWPDEVAASLPQHYTGVVHQLYGGRAANAWRAISGSTATSDLHHTQLFYPSKPHRAAQSGLLRMADLRLGHKVLRLEEGAAGVFVTSHSNGRTRRERFDRVVVAAGAMNSPVILQNSMIGGAQAGQNLTDHPMGFVAKLHAADPSPEFCALRHKQLDFDDSEPMLKIRDPETGLWSAFYLRSGVGSRLSSDPYKRSFGFLGQTSRFGKYRAALGHMHDPDFIWQAFENQLGVQLPSSHAYVLVVNEQESVGQGSVSELPDDRLCVDWQISGRVETAIRRNLVRLAEFTGAELITSDASLSDRLWSGAHHAGTCRMSPNIEDGVVDAELRVHGTENIYVCDASVLPSTGASNTGLTIAALARRLAAAWAAEKRNLIPVGFSRSRHLVISGATGAIGQMVRACLADTELDWSTIDLRDVPARRGAASPGSVFLHLANAHGSVNANLTLQDQAADFMRRAGVEQVIVPMSTSTILNPADEDPDPGQLNFGFGYTGSDPYPLGKLAAERFWRTWQAAAPGRQVLFVYIPTITGPRSEWTRDIAHHATGKTAVMPELENFFAVTENDLVDQLLALADEGLPQGESRRFAVSSTGLLSQAIAADRGGPVAAARLPEMVWRLIALSNSSGLAGKGLSVMRMFVDKALRAVSGKAILPVAPRYLHLFKRQSDMAGQIMQLSETPSQVSENPSDTYRKSA